MNDLGGRTLAGRYRLERLIGRGGMGVVYEAFQTDLGRRVAVKVLEDVDARALARFRAEALAAASITSPHVAVVFDFQANEGEPPFFAMELLDGAPLSKLIAQEAPLEAGRAVRIALELLDALGAAHAARLVHRDVKPSNVMLVAGGPGASAPVERVKLVDFGVAKLLDDDSGIRTTTGSVMGTPAYLAPEQIAGGGVDARTDVHAVGLVLYEMLTGTRPWPARGTDLLLALLKEPAPPLSRARPDVPASLVAVVARALEKDKDARFPSAEAMRAALVAASRELAPGRPARAEDAGAEKPAAVTRRERRASPFVLGLGVTLVTGVIAAGLVVASRSPRAPAPGQAEAEAAAEADAEAKAEAAAEAEADAEPEAEPEAEADAEADASDRSTTPRPSAVADPRPARVIASAGSPKRSGCICRWEHRELCPRPMPSQGCYCYPRDGRQTFMICAVPYRSRRCDRAEIGTVAGAPCSGLGPDGTTVEGRFLCEVCYEPFPRAVAVPNTPCRGVTTWGEEHDGLWSCP